MLIWHRIFCLLFIIRFGSAIVTQQQQDYNINNNKSNKKLDCPNYQYKCPDCPNGSKCVYPNSGGCEGAGIPVCQSQSQFCGNAVCLMKAFSCSEECSFSCEYTGPKCCPFIGKPDCYVCDTFAPCQETSCPKDCPNDCFYPDADWCCPKSGTPICKNSDNNIQLLPSTTTVTERTAAPGDKIYKRNELTMPSSKGIQSEWFSQPPQSTINVISSPTPTLSSRYSQSNNPSRSFDWFKRPVNQQQEQATSSNWFKQPVNQQQAQATSSSWFKQPINQQQEQATSSNWFKQPVNQQQAQDTSSNWFKQPVNQQEQQATSSSWFKQPVNQQEQQATSSNWFKQPVNQQQAQATSSDWFKQPIDQQQEQDSSFNWFKQPVNQQQEQVTSSNWFKQPVNQKEQQATSSNRFKQPVNQHEQQATSSNWFEQPVNQQQPTYVTPKIPLESNRAFYDNTQQKERDGKSEWLHQLPPDENNDNNRVLMEHVIPSAGLIEENCSSECPVIPVPTWGTCVVYQNPAECCPRIECVGVPISFDPEQSSTTIVLSEPTHSPYKSDKSDKWADEETALCPDYTIPC
ncbi:hypothetical protein BDC45DRAFT_569408 [Circinella umbellata]|nr:hypothetical protein BDC45DRAFT_569408 [Circinella umbellata]